MCAVFAKDLKRVQVWLGERKKTAGINDTCDAGFNALGVAIQSKADKSIVDLLERHGASLPNIPLPERLTYSTYFNAAQTTIAQSPALASTQSTTIDKLFSHAHSQASFMLDEFIEPIKQAYDASPVRSGILCTVLDATARQADKKEGNNTPFKIWFCSKTAF